MIKLSETENYLVIALLHPRNYTGLHNKLSQLLTEEEITFFARPEARGNQTAWWSAMDKQAGDFKAVAYQRLSKDEQDIVSDILEDQKKSLIEKFAKMPFLPSVPLDL